MGRGKKRRATAAPPTPVARHERKWMGWAVVAALLIGCGVVGATMFSRRAAPPAPLVESAAVAASPFTSTATIPSISTAVAPVADVVTTYAGSESCRECHVAAYD